MMQVPKMSTMIAPNSGSMRWEAQSEVPDISKYQPPHVREVQQKKNITNLRDFMDSGVFVHEDKKHTRKNTMATMYRLEAPNNLNDGYAQSYEERDEYQSFDQSQQYPSYNMGKVKVVRKTSPRKNWQQRRGTELVDDSRKRQLHRDISNEIVKRRNDNAGM